MWRPKSPAPARRPPDGLSRRSTGYDLEWVSSEETRPEIEPESYPFQSEHDAGDLSRHRMNLLFATAFYADALIARGHTAEAKRRLLEAAMLEPGADFIQERLKLHQGYQST